MKFDFLTPYNEMENNGQMVANVLTDKGLKVCEIEHTDLMGGVNEINGDINIEVLAVFLTELKTMIEEKGGNFYGWIDMEVVGDTITFTDDTEPFAELQGKQAFILDQEQLAVALSVIASYFWEEIA